MTEESCRADVWLWRARFFKTRSLAARFLDEGRVRMTRGGGTLVLAGAGRVRGPGHNSILVEGDQYYLVHHYYDADDNGRSRLQIRPLIWKEDGWPVADEPLPAPR